MENEELFTLTDEDGNESQFALVGELELAYSLLAGDVLAYGDYAKDFEAALAKSLTTLFDPAVPFVATEDRARCEWCDFAGLCKRK